MLKKEVLQLPLGLYRVFWNEKNGGGSSVAAVGMTESGNRWLAPANWFAPITKNTYKAWHKVERVELITKE